MALWRLLGLVAAVAAALVTVGALAAVGAVESGEVQSVAVLLLTFLTPSIGAYGELAVRINEGYARRRGYRLIVLRPEDHSLYRDGGPESDPRWFKVHMMAHAMEVLLGDRPCEFSATVCTQLSDDEALVAWLDADLIVIDWALDLAALAESQPRERAVLMSADVDHSTFLANSGFIVARVGPLALHLFRRWWQSYPRDRCCDQHALSWLVARDLNATERSAIGVLPAAALNSRFPAWRFQQTGDPVLHLAGETTLYRQTVFAAGLRSIHETCDSCDPPPQLGLTREVLLRHMRELNAGRAVRLRAIISEKPEPGHVRSVLVEVRDLIKRHETEAEVEAEALASRLPVVPWETVQALAIEALVAASQALCGEARIHAESSPTADWASAELIQVCLDAAFETAVLMGDASDWTGLPAYRFLDSLGPLAWHSFPFHLSATSTPAMAVVESSRRPVHKYYQFKLASLTALTFFGSAAAAAPSSLSSLDFRPRSTSYPPKWIPQRTANVELGLVDWLGIAATLWSELHAAEFYGTTYILAEPLREGVEAFRLLGLVLCASGQPEHGLPSLLKAVDLMNRTVEGYASLQIATEPDIDRGVVLLAELLVNAAICARDLGATTTPNRLHSTHGFLQTAERLIQGRHLASSSEHAQRILDTARQHIHTEKEQTAQTGSVQRIFRRKKQPQPR